MNNIKEQRKKRREKKKVERRAFRRLGSTIQRKVKDLAQFWLKKQKISKTDNAILYKNAISKIGFILYEKAPDAESRLQMLKDSKRSFIRLLEKYHWRQISPVMWKIGQTSCFNPIIIKFDLLIICYILIPTWWDHEILKINKVHSCKEHQVTLIIGRQFVRNTFNYEKQAWSLGTWSSQVAWLASFPCICIFNFCRYTIITSCRETIILKVLIKSRIMKQKDFDKEFLQQSALYALSWSFGAWLIYGYNLGKWLTPPSNYLNYGRIFT